MSAAILKSFSPTIELYITLGVSSSVVVSMCSCLTLKLRKPTGNQLVDLTKIEVCHTLRAKRNKVFEGIFTTVKALWVGHFPVSLT